MTNTFLKENQQGKGLALRPRSDMIEPMVRHRVQIRFRKSGNLCYIGHRDMMRTIERMLRRSRLPVSMSEGFHPKVRMSFPSALALGVSGEAEIMELDLTENLDTDGILRSLNESSVEGLTFYSAVKLPEGGIKARVVSESYEMILSDELCDKTTMLVQRFLSQSSLLCSKSNGKRVDVRAAVRAMTIIGHCLKMELAVTSGSDAGFREVLDQLELRGELFRTIFPVRISVNLAENLE